MKILHIIDGLEYGGAEVLLRNTLPLLDQYSHVVCYLGGKAPMKKILNDFFICLAH
jgi:hypothetical protein